MPKTRKIKRVFRSKPTIEGAGVHLKRAFGFAEVPQFDPFLLLDDFRAAYMQVLSNMVAQRPDVQILRFNTAQQTLDEECACVSRALGLRPREGADDIR